MSTRAPSLPMAPDVRYLWGLLEPALAARGLLELYGRRRQARRELAEMLAFAVAMERRAEVRMAELAGDRKRAERIRAHFRRQARVFAAMLGLIPVERVDAMPMDIQGHDPELAEWFGLDPTVMAAAIREALARPKVATTTTTRRNDR